MRFFNKIVRSDYYGQFVYKNKCECSEKQIQVKSAEIIKVSFLSPGYEILFDIMSNLITCFGLLFK